MGAAHAQWYRGKGLDTFCPLGPRLATPGRAFGPRPDLPLVVGLDGGGAAWAVVAGMLASGVVGGALAAYLSDGIISLGSMVGFLTVIGIVLTAAFVAAVGVLSSLDVLRHKPLATLRAE